MTSRDPPRTAFGKKSLCLRVRTLLVPFHFVDINDSATQSEASAKINGNAQIPASGQASDTTNDQLLSPNDVFDFEVSPASSMAYTTDLHRRLKTIILGVWME